MNILAIIPARFASSRLQGKPLKFIGDRPMIYRVYNSVIKSNRFTDTIIATDNEDINNYCFNNNLKSCITSVNHLTGTDRCREVVEKYYPNVDIVVNVQGDEPFLDKSVFDDLLSCFLNPKCDIATVYNQTKDWEEINNPNTVKLLTDNKQKVIYFSRYPIPYQRNKTEISYKKHIGLYGFKKDTLINVTNLQPSSLELSESLEQLRWIENGYSIYAHKTDYQSFGVDTEDDLIKANQRYNQEKNHGN